MLSGKGFKNVYNVAGGIKAWQSRTAVGPQDLGVDVFEGSDAPEDVLTVAYSLEQGLRAFYLTMGEKAENAEVKALFTKLSEIGVKHMESIVRTYQKLGHAQTTGDQFEGMAKKKAMEGGLTTEEYLDLFKPDLSSPVEVVSLAMSIEAQALDLYQRMGDRLSSEAARAVVLKIADEEKAHLASLGRLMESL